MTKKRQRQRVCVVVRLPHSTVLGFLGRPPRRGQRLRSGGDSGFITDVVQSGVNTYTVTCVERAEFLEDLALEGPRELAADLLSIARRSVRVRSDDEGQLPRQRQRGQRSADWIERYLFLGPQYGTTRTRAARAPAQDDWLERYLGHGPATRSASRTSSDRLRTSQRRINLRRLLERILP